MYVEVLSALRTLGLDCAGSSVHHLRRYLTSSPPQLLPPCPLQLLPPPSTVTSAPSPRAGSPSCLVHPPPVFISYPLISCPLHPSPPLLQKLLSLINLRRQIRAPPPIWMIPNHQRPMLFPDRFARHPAFPARHISLRAHSPRPRERDNSPYLQNQHRLPPRHGLLESPLVVRPAQRVRRNAGPRASERHVPCAALKWGG